MTYDSTKTKVMNCFKQPHDLATTTTMMGVTWITKCPFKNHSTMRFQLNQITKLSLVTKAQLQQPTTTPHAQLWWLICITRRWLLTVPSGAYGGGYPGGKCGRPESRSGIVKDQVNKEPVKHRGRDQGNKREGKSMKDSLKEETPRNNSAFSS